MEITEVRIKLMEDGDEKLQAFCSITFDDCFVIRDLKIIDGTNGPFVAMPSRKLSSHCPKCRSKNHLRARYCNDCGDKLNPNRVNVDDAGRAKLYADIAHPINSACREAIQERVIQEFRDEKERAKLPGYVSRYDDVDYDDLAPPKHSRRQGAAHPTVNYTRPGSEPATQIQLAEQTPPAPHKPNPDGAAVKDSDHRTPRDAPAKTANPPVGGFGAGIF